MVIFKLQWLFVDFSDMEIGFFKVSWLNFAQFLFYFYREEGSYEKLSVVRRLRNEIILKTKKKKKNGEGKKEKGRTKNGRK